ncbi:hypothetical protein [Actinopolymorpha rutila]|uniref:Uncharacterized protein n=1 Tax=Actinopolymorpha rutila TaxID=446787 RepID=A0A852ZGF3_9ACTN|nr:hypothetical protein [Actinopolymorpha rutila]NYH92177.1 hypothetical protein [Actinopolymorpha rutila]
MDGDQGGDENDEQYGGRRGDPGSGVPLRREQPDQPDQPEPTGRRALPWTDPSEPDAPSPSAGAAPATSYIDDEAADDDRFEPL